VKNLVSFRGLTHSTLTFSQGLDVPLVFDGPMVVTFFLPLVAYKNPLINLSLPSI